MRRGRRPAAAEVGAVLRLTHAGVLFKRHVEALIHDLDDGLAAVSQLVDPERGTVTVAFQLSLDAWLIPEIVRGFHRSHPRVDFRLEQSRDVLGSLLVAQGRVDVEFTSRRPRNPAVHWERLFTERLYPAVPPGHPAAGGSPVGLAEVAGEDFVMLRPEWELRQLTDRLCAASGITPTVVFESDDLATVHSFVAAGLGVAVLPAMGVDPERPHPGRPALVRLADPDAARDIGVAWSATRRLLPAAELFRGHVLAAGPHRGVAPPRSG